MSESENHHHGKNEIIVVKRHKGDHDGAHGGAWKIAYADFMTAMMAFFLVMWLVNAANEETKASVASFFNPIKLTDEKPADRGLKQPAKKAQGEKTQQQSDSREEKPADGAAAASGDEQTSSAGEQTAYSEANFFENPYAVLAEIAQEVGQQANVSVKGEGGASESGPSTGASGGEAYRDPFDPDFWSKQVDVPPATAGLNVQDTSLPEKQQTAQDSQAAAASSQDIASVISDAEPAVVQNEQRPQAASQAGSQPAAATQSAALNVDQSRSASAENPAKEDSTTEKLREEITQQVSGVAGKLAEGIVVTPAEGGTLITISEKANTAMFNIGSAVPERDLVLAMEKIGEVLGRQQGAIVIRGHTDGRAYSSGSRDNWTLSMDRAHAAYYMLVRGGLDETRIKQLSGFADRRLQTTDDPLAGSNRRIEILLEDG